MQTPLGPNVSFNPSPFGVKALGIKMLPQPSTNMVTESIRWQPLVSFRVNVYVVVNSGPACGLGHVVHDRYIGGDQ